MSDLSEEGKKCVKKVYLVSEKEKPKKEVFLVNDRECFALSHFILTKQNKMFVSVSVFVTVKVVNVTNYHVTV